MNAELHAANERIIDNIDHSNKGAGGVTSRSFIAPSVLSCMESPMHTPNGM